VDATAGWTQEGLAGALLAAYALPYARRARVLRRRGHPVPAWRSGSFAAALAVLALATCPPFDAAADERLSAHMAEHLLIGDIAPLLVVLGLTGPMLAPLLRHSAVQRLRALTHPCAAVALWAGDLYLWHLQFAYQAAVEHDLVHVLQHGCFFLAGANLWMALLGPLPKPGWFGTGARLAYVVTVRIGATVLAYAFVWAGHPLYPHYAATAAAAGRSPVADQSAAGAVMLVEESVVMVGLFAWLVVCALRDAERRQRLAELAAAHGVPLNERRIARAVAAGQADVLARRIGTGAYGERESRPGGG
jgi:putative membrane protein